MYLKNVTIWGRNPKHFLFAPLAALFCTPFSKLWWHRRYINFVTYLQLAPAPTIPRLPLFEPNLRHCPSIYEREAHRLHSIGLVFCWYCKVFARKLLTDNISYKEYNKTFAVGVNGNGITIHCRTFDTWRLLEAWVRVYWFVDELTDAITKATAIMQCEWTNYPWHCV